MTSSQRVLLTPGEMGPAEWAEVGRRLSRGGHRVVIDTELSYDRGIMAAAGSQLERLRDPGFWTSVGIDGVDLAVGFGVGAGPAAAMVTEGRTAAAILVDPDLTTLVMAHPDDIDVLAPEAGFELALQIAERLELFSENLEQGPFTREMVDIMCGTFTGEAWRIERAEMVAPFLMNRLTVDRAMVPTADDRHSSDWPSFAVDAAVISWLPAGSESLAHSLRSHGLNATVMPWGEAPWITSAAELAAAILDELRSSSAISG